MWKWIGLLIVGVALTVASRPVAAAEPPSPVICYVGTYTRGESKGIYAYRLDLKTGAFEPIGVTEGIKNPSFLAIHPNRKYLYAVSEIQDFNGQATGGVSAFEVNTASGVLTPLNSEPSGGAGPCHVVVDATGQNVLVANYGGGSVAVLRIGDDGRLVERSAFVQHAGSSVHPQRQSGPHAHSINVDAGNRFAVAADLGLDQLLVYRFDATRGTLAANQPAAARVAPGAGPRHFAFHPSGRFAYVINEMQSTVTAFEYDASKGVLETLQTTSTLPEDTTTNNSTAEVQVHRGGKFLYGSNRGHDSIAIFRIGDDGRLTAIGHQATGGKTPRNFGIDPTGQFLVAANQASDNLVVFRIDEESGQLRPTGVEVRVPSPVCVKFLSLDE